jgi:hypothetical protein
MCKNLAERREQLITFTEDIINEMNNTRPQKPGDLPWRTGLQIVIKELGKQNKVCYSIGKPSPETQTDVIKKAEGFELLINFSSRKDKFYLFQTSMYCCLVIRVNNSELLISIGGYEIEENILVGIELLAFILGMSPVDIYHYFTKNKVKLPYSLSKTTHYLHEILMNHHWDHYYGVKKME